MYLSFKHRSKIANFCSPPEFNVPLQRDLSEFLRHPDIAEISRTLGRLFAPVSVALYLICALWLFLSATKNRWFHTLNWHPVPPHAMTR